MFLIFGDKHRTEPVEGGLQERRVCPKCGESALFRERVVSKQFRIYFVEMFTHDTHRVMECSRCGTAFVTDELRRKGASNDHSGTLLGTIQGLAERGKRAVHDGSVGRALEQASAAAEQAGVEVGKALNAAEARARRVLDGLRDRDK